MTEIIIRTLHAAAEFEAAVELQKVYWGEDLGDLVPGHMLLSIARYGGHVHAAFDGERMVGMLLGFLGAEIEPDSAESAPDRLLIMSKRMVVLPGYRGQKIGERLKLAQADYARRHNIQLVTWTFDPLLSRNAYLNLHKLRAVGQKYVADYFGALGDNPVLSADRLAVNLWVNHPHVTQTQPAPPVDDAPCINQAIVTDDHLPQPGELSLPDAPVIRLEIPIEFVPVERLAPALGQAWRDTVREAFQQLIAAGYIATDFVRVQNRVFYVFTRDDHSFTFC